MLANQVDNSPEVVNNGNSFLFISCGLHLWPYRDDGYRFIVSFDISFNYRFMGFTILFIRMHSDAIVNISIIEHCSNCIITTLYIVIVLVFNLSLDFFDLSAKYI